MSTNLLINSIVSIAENNAEGFTVSASTLQPETKGYAVAIAETQNSFGVQGICNVLQAIAAGKANAIGGWLDRETGLYYFDAVVVLQDQEQAEKVAMMNNQLAYFDLNVMQEIRLKHSVNEYVA